MVPGQRFRRPYHAVFLALLLAFAAGVAGAAQGRMMLPATGLCGPLSPTHVRLPSWLTVGMANYTYQLNANAAAHSALCNIGLASPSDGYTYNVDLEVFPSHALAVSDFYGLDVSGAYRTVSSQGSAAGFPSPDFELNGIGIVSGKPVSDVTFVDGTTLVSAYIYGRGILPRTLQLGKWAASDLKAASHRT
jgi:hypothetical protein